MKPWLSKHKNWLVLVGMALLVAGLVVAMYISVKSIINDVIANAGNERQLVDLIRANGIRGIPIILSLEILLAMFTVISANPVHILSGLVYGIFFGSLISVLGLAIGNFLLFVLFKQFNRTFSHLIKPKKTKFLSIHNIQHMEHPEYLAFLIYLMPGIPNLVVPYMMARTHIKLWRYMVSVTLATVPAVLLCNLIGYSLADGNFVLAAIIAAIAVVLVAIAWFSRKRIMAFIRENEK
ncbi:VTT domain-containing protein [Candidatus Saccharibacteria bacterium]|nr:VTT domain-containing protein [Candidatus Saccharibacteria bacterium]